jgi:hypothetical protein
MINNELLVQECGGTGDAFVPQQGSKKYSVSL